MRREAGEIALRGLVIAGGDASPGLQLVDRALELPPQPLGVRAEPADRQVGLDELPLLVRQLHPRHAGRSTGSGPATRANPTDRSQLDTRPSGILE
ncbi:hypothetical protein Franean1_3380 [Parafrankia sp. EAN1pec]|nr:hypothetical protein Franean1_3380 [Frankia sp. EAN1pec]